MAPCGGAAEALVAGMVARWLRVDQVKSTPLNAPTQYGRSDHNVLCQGLSPETHIFNLSQRNRELLRIPLHIKNHHTTALLYHHMA